MKIHYFQHVPFEGPGAIAAWAGERGHRLISARLCDGDPLPTVGDLDWLVLLGGPMSAHDERTYPWLRREKRFIESAIGAGKVVLGICLGAQLIAEVLGAKVYANRDKEVGWFPIQRTPEALTTGIGNTLPAKAEVFHWHGETFSLPSGSVHLARSQACENQAFAYGVRVLGLQFHLETTPAAAQQLIQRCASDLDPGPYVQTADAMLGKRQRFAQINELMTRLLDRLAAPA